nr:sperm-associated antigen 16 protein [Chrysemys picta bellii]
MEGEAAVAGAEGPFCLQQVTITEDSEDDYQYEEVPADDDFSLLEGDEDLIKALQTIQEQAEDAQIIAQQSVLTSKHSVSEIPEVVDDFLCNFLVRMGMVRTLDCFQTEWYELMQKGAIERKDIGFVPDMYTYNQHLEMENRRLKKELENYKLAASKAKEALQKIQKERDFHRMHHKRVVQEKNRLISDIKRLKAHYASYEPMLKQLTEKYQTILRQKMLTNLERDRAVGQVTGLQATLQNLESGRASEIPVTRAGHRCEREDGRQGPTQKAVQENREQKYLYAGVAPYDPAKDPTKQMGKRYSKDSEFPIDTQVNPYLARAKECTRPLKSGVYRLSSTLKVHDLAVSCLRECYAYIKSKKNGINKQRDPKHFIKVQSYINTSHMGFIHEIKAFEKFEKFEENLFSHFTLSEHFKLWFSAIKVKATNTNFTTVPCVAQLEFINCFREALMERKVVAMTNAEAKYGEICALNRIEEEQTFSRKALKALIEDELRDMDLICVFPLCIAFVDYENTFDIIEINALLKALAEQGIDTNYIKLLKEVNSDCTMDITLFDTPLYIPVKKGVKQGDTVLPKLFMACIEMVMRQMNWKGGISINGEQLNHLRFTDDITLIAENTIKLQKML